MMRAQIFLVTIIALTHVAIADAPKPPVLKNTYAFDYMSPQKSKCAQVTGALATKLAKYTCTKPDDGSTASGKPAVADCKAPKGDSAFLAFAKLADCKTERETQLANAE
jgi:hypothetical protein